MKHLFAKSLLSLAALTGVSAIPTTAQAGDRYWRDRDRVDFRINVDRGADRCEPRRVWVEPVFEERKSQVWVEPVYRTDSVPVFVNERVETRCERVWVEPVFQVREVVRFDHCGRRICSRERVCVRDGHWENVERPVVIPAHYRHEDQQVLVTPGHYETRCDRVCVREGHWETVAEGPAYNRDRFSLNVGLGGRF